MTRVPAMRYKQLEERWSDHGRPCEAIYRAQDVSGYIDHIDAKVTRVIEEDLEKRGLSCLLTDISYDSEGDWYHVYLSGEILASEIVDPEFVRDVTATLGVHRYCIDTPRRRLGVRDPIADLAITVLLSEIDVKVVVGPDNEVDSEPPNAGLVSTVRCYFWNLQERLCELGVETFYGGIDEYMKDQDLWFLVDGTPCDPGESLIYVPHCKGQQNLFGKGAA